jgi:hypothetical protein
MLFGPILAVLAFRGPAEHRQGRLVLAGLGLAIWVFLMTVVFYALAFGTWENETSDDNSFFFTWGREGPFVVLDVVAGVALTLAAVLTVTAFARMEKRPYRMLSWSGLCIAAYYLLDPPRTIWQTAATPAVGSFWLEPAAYMSIVLGILAGLTVWRAFSWYRANERLAGSLAFAEREYLLAVAAFSLFVPRLLGLSLVDWSIMSRAADETMQTAVVTGIIYLSMVLLLPTLFFTGAAGFLVSSRQMGWRASRWTGSPTADGPQSWGRRLLLTWRLPLLYGWLLLLVAASSFLGYYGLATLAPAAAMYLWLLARERRTRLRTR